MAGELRREAMGSMKFNQVATVFVAAIALLGQVNCRIYQTNDAIVFEIDRTWDGTFLAKSFPFSQSDFVPISAFLNGDLFPKSYIPFGEPTPSAPITPYSSIGLHPQLGPTFQSWLHQPFAYGGAYVVPAISSKSGQPTIQEKASIPCGKGPEANRIVNGAEAKPNSWPFIVGFMIPSSGVVRCGGSLISETKILSAAHCFEPFSMFQLSQMVVKLGMHNSGDGKDEQDDAEMTRRIKQITIHKAYNAQTSYFDIAIVTLDTPITYSKAISPVCLAPASNNVDLYAGETASIMGWGKLESGGASSQKLMEAKVPIITNEECKKIYKEPGEIANNMLCATSSDADTCQGDSGGPLVVKAEDGSWTQAGIVSFGKGCANAEVPAGVYARVNWLRGWINGNMKN